VTPLHLLRAPLAGVALASLAACAGGRRAPAVPRPTVPAPSALAGGLGVSESDLTYLRERALQVPVAGVRAGDLRSTFDAPRDGGARQHAALDIMAPRGTPILSADDGRVWKIRSNGLGGLTVYATDPGERFVYYYAHLDGYFRGLTEGQPLAKGDTLGYVGSTGNASAGAPHLHFQVSRVAAPGQWWGGTPVDPTSLLTDRPGAEVADTREGRGKGTKVRKDGRR
jgi:murein DD-endopeptidase MepM/ murein hydrolase activator NlpD